MTDRPSWSAWAVLALSVAMVIVLRGTLLTTGSIDFTAHLSLVDFISNNIDFPRWSGNYHTVKVIPHLGVMTIYPPIAHAAGALAGWVLGSTVVGMNAVALASVLAVYIVLLYLCFKADNLVCAILFTIAALALGPYGYVHGGQIISNYFFAHLFGTAAALYLLYISVFLLNGWWAIAFATGSAIFLGWVYPFSEIQFAASFLVYLAVVTLTTSISEKAMSWRPMLQTAVATVLLLLATVLHPEFRIMIAISANDGGFLPIVATKTITTIAMTLLMVGILLIYLNIRCPTTVGMLIAGLAVGVSTIYALQWLALVVLHFGSPYALKKYLFDLVTLLCLALSFAIGVPAGKRILSARLRPSRVMIASSVLALGITLVMFGRAPSVAIPNTTQQTSTAVIDRHKRYTADLMTYQLPDNAYGVTVSMVPGLSSSVAFEKVLNLSVSTIEMGMDFRRGAGFFYEGKTAGIRYALVPSTGPLGIEECRVTKPTHLGIVAVDYACAESGGSRRTVETRAGGVKYPFLASGWGDLESDGVWSVADLASLKLKLRDVRRGHTPTLVLNFVGGFLSEKHKTQRVIVKIDGRVLGAGELKYSVAPESIEVRLPSEVASGEFTVDLVFPDAISPKDITGGEDDPRKLAVKLRSFVLK